MVAPLSRPSAATVRRLALTSLLANVAIVVTGGGVRLTGSGLGCPTWPRCTEDSYVVTRELAAHGLVEFGNRLLTFVIGFLVLAAFVAAVRQRPRRNDVALLGFVVLLGIPAQAVLGGITVRTGLNPWTVMGHFLLSSVLIGLATWMHHRTKEGDRVPRLLVAPALRSLAVGLLVVTAVTLVLGTLVTGSGPHAGDAAAARTGFDPATVSQLHADAVMLLVGLTVAFYVALRAIGADRRVVGAAGILLVVELAQGAIGYVQYFTDLPVLLVAAHMLGACAVLVAAVKVVLSARDRGPVGDGPVAVPAQASATLSRA